jgi:hypothetical protein
MRVSAYDQLEERANNRVLDEEPLCRELERRRALEHSCKASSVVPKWVNQISEEVSSTPTPVGATTTRRKMHYREKES